MKVQQITNGLFEQVLLSKSPWHMQGTRVYLRKMPRGLRCSDSLQPSTSLVRQRYPTMDNGRENKLTSARETAEFHQESGIRT